jgi:hypothetical protein
VSAGCGNQRLSTSDHTFYQLLASPGKSLVAGDLPERYRLADVFNLFALDGGTIEIDMSRLGH